MGCDDFKIAGSASAHLEARQLFKMLGKDGQSVESTRALIRPSVDSCDAIRRYRATILGFFDEFVRAGRIVRKRSDQQRRIPRAVRKRARAR